MYKGPFSNRMLGMFFILLLITIYFSFDLYIKGIEKDKKERPIKAVQYSPTTEKSEIKEETHPINVSGNRPETEMIQPNAILSMEKHYSVCNHTIKSESVVPSDLVNLTKKQLASAYSEWQIKDFSPKKIIMTQTINSKCQNHFVLKIKDGFVAVFYEKPINGVSLKELTPLPASSLPEKERKKLEEGITLESLDELSQVLEDLGS